AGYGECLYQSVHATLSPLFRRIFLLFPFFLFQAEDGIRYRNVTGVQTCALPILRILAKSSAVVEWIFTPSWVSSWASRPFGVIRSEERRVGKESEGRGTREQGRTKTKNGVKGTRDTAERTDTRSEIRASGIHNSI